VSDNKKHILIESYSLTTLVVSILSPNKIIFYKVGMVDYFPNYNVEKNIWEKIGVKLYGKNHVVKAMSYSNNFDKKSQVVWSAHKDSLLYLEKFSEDFRGNRLGRYLIELTGSENILIAIQKSILERISKKILLLKVYEFWLRPESCG